MYVPYVYMYMCINVCSPYLYRANWGIDLKSRLSRRDCSNCRCRALSPGVCFYVFLRVFLWVFSRVSLWVRHTKGYVCVCVCVCVCLVPPTERCHQVCVSKCSHEYPRVPMCSRSCSYGSVHIIHLSNCHCRALSPGVCAYVFLCAAVGSYIHMYGFMYIYVHLYINVCTHVCIYI